MKKFPQPIITPVVKPSMSQHFPQRIVAAFCTGSTVVRMRRIGKLFCTTAFVGMMALMTGCSGIHASKSVSPLDFILPGLMKNDAPTPPVNNGIAPPATAVPVV
jgi:hypothetical protein